VIVDMIIQYKMGTLEWLPTVHSRKFFFLVGRLDFTTLKVHTANRIGETASGIARGTNSRLSKYARQLK
jgi:hypothetical protein